MTRSEILFPVGSLFCELGHFFPRTIGGTFETRVSLAVGEGLFALELQVAFPTGCIQSAGF